VWFRAQAACGLPLFNGRAMGQVMRAAHAFDHIRRFYWERATNAPDDATLFRIYWRYMLMPIEKCQLQNIR
jgi:hypothetical protein